jgi:hypothetical protein
MKRDVSLYERVAAAMVNLRHLPSATLERRIFCAPLVVLGIIATGPIIT